MLVPWEKNRRKIIRVLQNTGEIGQFWGNGLWSQLATLEVETTYEQSNRLLKTGESPDFLGSTP